MIIALHTPGARWRTARRSQDAEAEQQGNNVQIDACPTEYIKWAVSQRRGVAQRCPLASYGQPFLMLHLLLCSFSIAL
ncbi:MAG: hypothetical protein WCD86_22455 [Ktedonobacteraceae bacterium]